jgi:hypothetical protein
MELYRAQILLGKKQHETLSRIADEERRSVSEIVREMIDRRNTRRLKIEPSLKRGGIYPSSGWWNPSGRSERSRIT